MPIIQVLLISALGALMATQYFDNLLSERFRKSLNKVRDANAMQAKLNIMNLWTPTPVQCSPFHSFPRRTNTGQTLHDSNLTLSSNFYFFGLPVLQVVFLIFTPSLVFSSFAKSVSLEDMISWYAWIRLFHSQKLCLILWPFFISIFGTVFCS